MLNYFYTAAVYTVVSYAVIYIVKRTLSTMIKLENAPLEFEKEYSDLLQ